MINLADRLFQIIDDEPVYTPVLINISCFKELYMADTTDDKHKYAQHLLYIWYTCDPASPYFYAEDKLEEAALEVYGRSKVITKTLKKCMEEYSKRQSTPMIRAFERAMKITDQNESILNRDKKQMEEWERLITDCNELMSTLGKNPEDIATRIDLMDRIEDLEAKKLKRQSEMSKMIPTINKQVKELLELKKEVDKDRMQLNSDDTKEAISNYIVDEFIDKYV
jgi:hypothetical protein